MSRQPRPAVLRIVAAAALTLAVAAAGALPAASSAESTPSVVTVPAAGSSIIPPLSLSATFPGPGGKITLFDDEGHELPPTGAGVTVDGNRLVFSNPDLERGRYTLRWEYLGTTGASDFIVSTGQPNYIPDARETESGSRFNLVPLGVGLGLASLILVALRRRLLVAVPLAVLMLAGSGAAGWAMSQERPTELTACLTIGTEWNEERRECAKEWVLASGGQQPDRLVAALQMVSAEKRLGAAENQPCHNISHDVGRELANRGADVAALAAADPGLCAWGLTHGALERKAVLLTDDSWKKLAAQVCVPFSGEAAIQCAHGLGHASALRSNSNMEFSYATCQQLDHIGPVSVSSCAEGATMNWTSRLQFSADGGAIDRSLLGFPQTPFIAATCQDLEDATRAGCWRGAFLYLGSTQQLKDPDLPLDLLAILSFCSGLERDDLACIYSAMFHAGDFPRAIPQEESVTGCSSLTGVQRHVCMQGSVNGWVNRGFEGQRQYTQQNRARRCSGFAAGFSDADRTVCAGLAILDKFTLERRPSES